MDVIKEVDYIIDIGQNGGKNGGEVDGQGTAEKVTKIKKSKNSKIDG